VLLPSHAVCEWKILNEEIDEYEHEYGDDGGGGEDDNDR
jgi:hypothetical protein